MIELKFTGMCEGCKLADLRLQSLCVDNFTYWMVICEHEPVCNKWQKDQRDKVDE